MNKSEEEDEVLSYLSNIQPRKEDKGAFWMGVFFVFVALAFPAYQALLWLQSGVWTPLPISLLWHPRPVDWVGAQKIIDWVFDLPMWSIPAFLAFGSFSAWRETV
jgi:hypothetical protein